MKITKLQKKIVLSTFGFILSWREIRYVYLKYLKDIVRNGNYFDWSYLLNIFLFILSLVVFVASIVGFVIIVREIWNGRQREVVSERFIKLFINSFWTLIISIVLAMVVKILIWP